MNSRRCFAFDCMIGAVAGLSLKSCDCKELIFVVMIGKRNGFKCAFLRIFYDTKNIKLHSSNSSYFKQSPIFAVVNKGNSKSLLHLFLYFTVLLFESSLTPFKKELFFFRASITWNKVYAHTFEVIIWYECFKGLNFQNYHC